MFVFEERANVFLMLITAILLTIIPFSSFSAKGKPISKNVETKVELRGGDIKYTFPKDQVYDFGVIEIKTPASANKAVSRKIENQKISDMRGTGEGYTLTAAATRFTNVNNPSIMLEPGTLKIKAPDSSNFERKTGTGIGNGKIYHGTNSIDGSSVTLLKAERNAGMGEYTLNYANDSLRFQIVQDDARRGFYESTITFTLLLGP